MAGIPCGGLGLCIAVAVGRSNFDCFGGAREVDTHVRHTALKDNCQQSPCWATGIKCHVALPRSHPLRGRFESFACHLQQADMESNGKSWAAQAKRLPGIQGPWSGVSLAPT